MSTIKADTLSDLAGTYTVPVATVAQGSAKAWVNFNGTGTVAINGSFNVTSITDGGTGTYTVNFTNALLDANYVGVITCGTTSSQNNPGQTVSAFTLLIKNNSNALVDDSRIQAAFFR